VARDAIARSIPSLSALMRQFTLRRFRAPRWKIAAGYLIEGDVHGDGKADFSIEIVNPTHSITLTSADFTL
jgi:hypothetical protein